MEPDNLYSELHIHRRQWYMIHSKSFRLTPTIAEYAQTGLTLTITTCLHESRHYVITGSFEMIYNNRFEYDRLNPPVLKSLAVKSFDGARLQVGVALVILCSSECNILHTHQ